MACCTTIPPLNNPSQKRKSGGIFDMPRSAKQRRPLSSTLTTTSPFLTSTSQSSTMFTTASSLQNKSIFIEADSSKNKASVFQMKGSYSPLGSIWSEENSACQGTDTSSIDESQFKNDLMERIRHEAKRLIKRKQMTVDTTLTTSTESTNSPSTASNTATNNPLTNEITTKPTLNAISSSLSLSSSSSPFKKASNHNDMPIFSMNQVNMICERMLGERETAIREQYDKILTQKMSEQYDAFVKFTHEQIQRRFESSQCSYVS